MKGEAQVARACCMATRTQAACSAAEVAGERRKPRPETSSGKKRQATSRRATMRQVESASWPLCAMRGSRSAVHAATMARCTRRRLSTMRRRRLQAAGGAPRAGATGAVKRVGWRRQGVLRGLALLPSAPGVPLQAAPLEQGRGQQARGGKCHGAQQRRLLQQQPGRPAPEDAGQPHGTHQACQHSNGRILLGQRLLPAVGTAREGVLTGWTQRAAAVAAACGSGRLAVASSGGQRRPPACWPCLW